jgi:hypothetical protein
MTRLNRRKIVLRLKKYYIDCSFLELLLKSTILYGSYRPAGMSTTRLILLPLLKMTECNVCMMASVADNNKSCDKCSNKVCSECYRKIDKCPFCRYAGYKHECTVIDLDPYDEMMMQLEHAMQYVVLPSGYEMRTYGQFVFGVKRSTNSVLVHVPVQFAVCNVYKFVFNPFRDSARRRSDLCVRYNNVTGAVSVFLIV